MATTCFCGHGSTVKGIRLRATNSVGAQMQTDLALFEGVLADGLAGDRESDLTELIASGRPLVDVLSAAVHDQPRPERAKDEVKDWLDRAKPHRSAIETAVCDAGWIGSWTQMTSTVVYTGTRARGTVVKVRDTGTTVNENPKVEITVGVDDPSGNPLELSRKLLVSRVNIPRPNDAVEVAFDPDEPSDFVFRLVAASDAPDADETDDRLDQLERLQRLRESGALSDAEFEAEKQRILGHP